MKKKIKNTAASVVAYAARLEAASATQTAADAFYDLVGDSVGAALPPAPGSLVGTLGGGREEAAALEGAAMKAAEAAALSRLAAHDNYSRANVEFRNSIVDLDFDSIEALVEALAAWVDAEQSLVALSRARLHLSPAVDRLLGEDPVADRFVEGFRDMTDEHESRIIAARKAEGAFYAALGAVAQEVTGMNATDVRHSRHDDGTVVVDWTLDDGRRRRLTIPPEKSRRPIDPLATIWEFARVDGEWILAATTWVTDPQALDELLDELDSIRNPEVTA